MGLISRVSSRTYREKSEIMAKSHRDNLTEQSYDIRQIHENSSDNVTVISVVLTNKPSERIQEFMRAGGMGEQPTLELSHDLSRPLPKDDTTLSGSMVIGGEKFTIAIDQSKRMAITSGGKQVINKVYENHRK